MIRDSYCDSELRGSTKLRGQTIVLNHQKWNGILNNLNNNKKKLELNEKEKQYQEYLRQGSRTMTRTWENSVEKIRERKNQQRLQMEHEKIAEDQRRYQELKENDENKRLQDISKANDLLKRFKFGPRQLESAYILSETMRAQDIQRQLNNQLAVEQHQIEVEEGKQLAIQSEQWKQEQKDKLIMEKSITNDYKKNLYQSIKDDEEKNVEQRNNQIREEKQQCKLIDVEIQSQIEQERLLLQRKKLSLRENALEAMRIAEQRRLRDRMTNNIENNIISIYANGKQRIDDIKKAKAKQLQNEKLQLTNKVAVQLFADDADDKIIFNEKCMARANLEYEKRMNLIEQQRLEHNRKLKAARIRSHLQEMEIQRERQQEQFINIQCDYQQRVHNEIINNAYEKEQRLRQHEKSLALRKTLQRQMDERMEMEKIEKEQNLIDDTIITCSNATDDKEFFEYSNELILQAKEKGRPILPIIRTIENYKKINGIQQKIEILPHLKSIINIGVKEQQPLKATKDCSLNPCDTNNNNNNNNNLIQLPSSTSSIIKYNMNELKEMNPIRKYFQI